MAFGVNEQTRAGNVPQVSTGNMPINQPNVTDLGMSSLADSLSASSAARRREQADKALGQYAAEQIRNVSTMQLAGASPVEIRIARQRAAAEAAARFGADAAKDFHTILSSATGKEKIQAVNGRLYMTDENGNILSQIQEQVPQTQHDVIAEMTQEYANEIYTRAPTFARRAEDLLRTTGAITSVSPQYRTDIARMFEGAAHSMATVDASLDRLAYIGNNPVSVDVVEQLKTQTLSDVYGAFGNVVNHMQSDLMIGLLRDPNNDFTPADATAIMDGLITDMYNTMQVSGAFSKLGVDPVEFRATLGKIVHGENGLQSLYEGAHTSSEATIKRKSNIIGAELEMAKDETWLDIKRTQPEIFSQLVTAQASKYMGEVSTFIEGIVNAGVARSSPQSLRDISNVSTIMGNGVQRMVLDQIFSQKIYEIEPAMMQEFVRTVDMFTKNPVLLPVIVDWFTNADNVTAFTAAAERHGYTKNQINDIFNDIKQLDQIIETVTEEVDIPRRELQKILNGYRDIGMRLLG